MSGTFSERCRRLARRSGGFTLVELMVAVTGGLFVSVAVFVLAQQATGLYQAETRLGNATFGNLVGFDRLRADISRAGYLVTPNIQRDPALCGDPVGGGGWPTWLKRIASVFIAPIPAADMAQPLVDNGLQPEQIVLAGAYTTTDQFSTGPVVPTGSGIEVYLNPTSPAMARLGYDNAADATEETQLLQSVFPAQHMMRLVDKTGREQYGVIASVTPGAQPLVTLVTGTPQLQFRSGNAQRCGINDLGAGSLVNPVSLIRYAIRPASNLSATQTTAYGPAVNTTNAPPFDTGRTELVRVALDANGAEIDDSLEIVTEFAVDLRFGITAATAIAPTGTSLNQTVLTTFPAGDTQVHAYAGAPSQWPPASGPQHIRSVRARLSVRSREPDRAGNIQIASDGGGIDIAPGLYRMKLPNAGDEPYARVRTLQADVALRNQMGVMWQ